MDQVSIVIPNWNGADVLINCLDSLSVQTKKPDQIIVVDNGSIDESVALLKNKYPHVVLVELARNIGFTGGVNNGIKKAKGDYIILLNNDAVVAKDWLAQLTKAVRDYPEDSIFTSKILVDTGTTRDTIDSTGDFYSPYGLPFPRGRGEKDEGQYDKLTDIFGASGGASLYKKEIFPRIGYFDQAFFAYFEDVDISFRARLAGFSVRYVPSAVVYHKLGHTSGGTKSKFSRYHTMKNNWYVYVKNMPARLFWKYLPYYLLTQLLLWVSSIRSGLILTHLRAAFVALIRTPQMLARRTHIQSTRELSAKDVELILYRDWPPMQKESLKRYFPWAFRK